MDGTREFGGVIGRHYWRGFRLLKVCWGIVMFIRVSNNPMLLMPILFLVLLSIPATSEPKLPNMCFADVSETTVQRGQFFGNP